MDNPIALQYHNNKELYEIRDEAKVWSQELSQNLFAWFSIYAYCMFSPALFFENITLFII